MKTFLRNTAVTLTLVGALLVIAPMVASAAPATGNAEVQAATNGTSAAAAAPTIDQQRDALAARLVEKGADPRKAELAVSQLNADDVQVLYENPDMMQAAGDISEEEAILIAFGVVICVLLIIIIF